MLTGRDAVAEFVDGVAGRLYETQAFEYRPLDDNRIVIEGRLRSLDDDRILRDDPMMWAFEFLDGLLRRSAPEGALRVHTGRVTRRPWARHVSPLTSARQES